MGEKDDLKRQRIGDFKSDTFIEVAEEALIGPSKTWSAHAPVTGKSAPY